MKTPDELLNKHAKIHMKQWDLKQFKLKYPSLYKVFVGAINEASVKDTTCTCESKFKHCVCG